ncbi:Poly-beta-1,6-N-acetyl-D-glucosamine synthase [Roseivivax sp. THAF40]|uniref:glycosyltransferase family 2 protein n=1 Tax=unclassified Roseivivax TaxID=2639302 RepID=UPI001267862B|nr:MULTISPECIES: glycosyltransferase [unclassified Roseivivax]QFS84595.1 Poly-beta-1,6-N-acetyl-D-glucosamine synthase [Roseivivax sp. THAF197b]QFT48422.1 Poly-beta-1,6-N-acetyl-D-glucosamine synthase [Roseivivax sp. THAF40]
MTDNAPHISVIIPASNEAGHIGACLTALLASDWTADQAPEIIVVDNGSTDDTAGIARGFEGDFAAKGWALRVITAPRTGKPSALNSGDAAARAQARVYLDADVIVSPPLLAQIADALADPQPRFVTGTLNIVAPENAASRGYARVWAQVPFMADCVPGCGLFAVNAAGRMRWAAFPALISDDTFVRLHFKPHERHAVPARYEWPVVTGFGNLVRVRARQDRGVAEIARAHPELLGNDDHRPFPLSRKLAIAARDPLGFAVYSGVALAARLRPAKDGWSRGR